MQKKDVLKKTQSSGTEVSNEFLFSRVRELDAFAMGLLMLAEVVPDRFTLAQSVFFLLAAAADLEGKPSTFTAIRDAAGEGISRSLHSTYKVLLDGSRRNRSEPTGLRWLKAHPDPNDSRQKILKLTPKGREVIRGILTAYEETLKHS